MLPNHFCYFMGHREPEGRQQIQSTSQLTLISKSTSDPLYFPHFPIQQASNHRFTQPSQPLPPTHLELEVTCQLLTSTTFAPKVPLKLGYIKYPLVFPGGHRTPFSGGVCFFPDIKLGIPQKDPSNPWAPGRPFFHKGAELRRTSKTTKRRETRRPLAIFDQLVFGTFQSWFDGTL